MKKSLSFILVLALLLTLPVTAAAEEAPSTPLQYGTSIQVLGIKAIYTVKTENVDSLTVTFTDPSAVTQWNYIADQNKLVIAVASARPLDLSGPVARVTAVLKNGTSAAPELELTGLYFNDQAASENLTVGTCSAALTGSTLTASVPAHSDFLNNAYTVMAGVYDSQGKMIACSIRALSFAEKKDVTLELTFSDCGQAAEVKVFFLTEALTPLLNPVVLSVS